MEVGSATAVVAYTAVLWLMCGWILLRLDRLLRHSVTSFGRNRARLRLWVCLMFVLGVSWPLIELGRVLGEAG